MLVFFIWYHPWCLRVGPANSKPEPKVQTNNKSNAKDNRNGVTLPNRVGNSNLKPDVQTKNKSVAEGNRNGVLMTKSRRCLCFWFDITSDACMTCVPPLRLRGFPVLCTFVLCARFCLLCFCFVIQRMAHSRNQHHWLFATLTLTKIIPPESTPETNNKCLSLSLACVRVLWLFVFCAYFCYIFAFPVSNFVLLCVLRLCFANVSCRRDPNLVSKRTQSTIKANQLKMEKILH